MDKPKGKRGGRRPGAGRKPKPRPVPVVIGPPVDAEPVPANGRDTLKLLQDIAFGLIDATPIQVRAAIAAAQYTHTKRSDGGKKEGQLEAAKQAASKFARQSPPKLVAKNGQTV